MMMVMNHRDAGRVSGMSMCHVTLRRESRLGQVISHLWHSVASATAMPGEQSKRSNIIDV